MPELPEVEEAARRLRRAIIGRCVTRVRLLHPSFRARLPARRASTLRGASVSHVDRRGKHQVIHFVDGRTLHAHFRMNGDWEIGRTEDPVPRFARALVELDDGVRVALIDSRALATLTLHSAGEAPTLALGPEPGDLSLDAGSLGRSLATRRGAIKPALLDQRVLAGIGNIYAAEALWRARIDPFKAANALSERERTTLIAALRAVIDRASGGRYRDSDSADAAPSTVSRLDVYDREGKPCRRCRTPIERAVQAGRSTYFCRKCQGVIR
jgi:formamidopyrimidine-DNA glycosylase